MTETRVCRFEPCSAEFETNNPRREFCSDTCRSYQWYVDHPEAGRVFKNGSLLSVATEPLQEVRDQRAATKHNRDLGGLIRQAIVDRLKTTGECAPEDLIALYPEGEVDLCRRLATAQFGSLAASRDGKEPLIREKERRKSTIPARKGAKVSVWELTPSGRRHYGIGNRLAEVSSENSEGSTPAASGTLDRPGSRISSSANSAESSIAAYLGENIDRVSAPEGPSGHVSASDNPVDSPDPGVPCPPTGPEGTPLQAPPTPSGPAQLFRDESLGRPRFADIDQDWAA